VHNTRVERIWPEINKLVSQSWLELFQLLEDEEGLTMACVGHPWLLHFLFLRDINGDLQAFQQTFNNHPNRSTSFGSPIETYIAGLAQYGDRHNQDFASDDGGLGLEEENARLATEVHEAVFVDDVRTPFGEGGEEAESSCLAALEAVWVVDRVQRWQLALPLLESYLEAWYRRLADGE
jgi:hypothetical protein